MPGLATAGLVMVSCDVDEAHGTQGGGGMWMNQATWRCFPDAASVGEAATIRWKPVLIVGMAKYFDTVGCDLCQGRGVRAMFLPAIDASTATAHYLATA